MHFSNQWLFFVQGIGKGKLFVVQILFLRRKRQPIMKAMMILMVGSIVLSAISLARAANTNNISNASRGNLEKATFAGGCFWCMEPPFDGLDGVISIMVGYTGGAQRNPTYEEVSSGKTGHAEAIKIVYDSSRITYAELLDVFWSNIDPTQVNGQFVDIGNQYRTAIFYHSEKQKRLALASKDKLEASGRYDKQIVTEIVPASEFYRAEEYHQSYYKKNPLRYKFYRYRSGRDQFLERVWHK